MEVCKQFLNKESPEAAKCDGSQVLHWSAA